MSARRALLASAALASAALFTSPAAAVSSCGGEVHQAECGGGNIYPCCDNGGNCTWWAWESVCRSWHVALVNWGNANTWAGHADVDPNYDVLSYPVVGSIATRDLGTYGHVAWVVGVNGNTVTVTEENCCGTCAPGMRQWSYQASYFNSGYVVRHGVTCQCQPGATESQACGDCGSRARTCEPSCNWGGWGGCEGPDPGGGNQACETGATGPCAEGRVRCVGGNTSCQPLVSPSAEVCDGVDNDCNGAVDDGHPPLGDEAPAHAAALVDMSHPQTLRSGEHALIWADFRNVGSEPWPRDGLWLVAHGGADGGASLLFTPESWPAWNVAAALDRPVLPGEIGRFAFAVVGPADAGMDIEERFQLEVPGADLISCPEAEITVRIHVLPALAGSGGAGGAADTDPADPARCSAAPRPAGPGAGTWLALSLLGLGCARTRLSSCRRPESRRRHPRRG